MKAVPNIITSIRIVFSVFLLTAKPLSLTFNIIYVICGISDALDGFIARKTKQTSQLGARLDSMADLIMCSVLMLKLYPVLKPSAIILIWIVLIAATRFTAAAIAYKKYKAFAMLHTYANKFTGLILFVFPLLLNYNNANILMIIVCAVASISAAEELIIQINCSELLLNRKSIIQK